MRLRIEIRQIHLQANAIRFRQFPSDLSIQRSGWHRYFYLKGKTSFVFRQWCGGTRRHGFALPIELLDNMAQQTARNRHYELHMHVSMSHARGGDYPPRPCVADRSAINLNGEHWIPKFVWRCLMLATLSLLHSGGCFVCVASTSSTHTYYYHTFYAMDR